MQPPKPPPVCKSRRQLADQFAIAARLYAEAVVALTRNYVSMSRNDYDRLREAVREAQRRSEAMRMAYEEHIELHRCAAEQEYGTRVCETDGTRMRFSV